MVRRSDHCPCSVRHQHTGTDGELKMAWRVIRTRQLGSLLLLAGEMTAGCLAQLCPVLTVPTAMSHLNFTDCIVTSSPVLTSVMFTHTWFISHFSRPFYETQDDIGT